MVYDVTLIYQHTVCSFTAVFGSGFRLKLQSVGKMASSRKRSLEDEIEQSLLGELTASNQSRCRDDDDFSEPGNLTVFEVKISECSDSESDDVQCAPARSAHCFECYIYLGGHEICRPKATVC